MGKKKNNKIRKKYIKRVLNIFIGISFIIIAFRMSYIGIVEPKYDATIQRVYSTEKAPRNSTDMTKYTVDLSVQENGKGHRDVTEVKLKKFDPYRSSSYKKGDKVRFYWTNEKSHEASIYQPSYLYGPMIGILCVLVYLLFMMFKFRKFYIK